MRIYFLHYFLVFFRLLDLYLIDQSFGEYFSRYNPNYFEYLFGSGPINFGQFYGEQHWVKHLLHATLILSIFIYIFWFNLNFGLLTWFIFKLFQARNRNSIYGFIFLLFIFVNLIQSDSLNYLNSLMLYSFITYKHSKKIKILNSKFNLTLKIKNTYS